MSLFDTLMTLSDMAAKHDLKLVKKPVGKKGVKK